MSFFDVASHRETNALQAAATRVLQSRFTTDVPSPDIGWYRETVEIPATDFGSGFHLSEGFDQRTYTTSMNADEIIMRLNGNHDYLRTINLDHDDTTFKIYPHPYEEDPATHTTFALFLPVTVRLSFVQDATGAREIDADALDDTLFRHPSRFGDIDVAANAITTFELVTYDRGRSWNTVAVTTDAGTTAYGDQQVGEYLGGLNRDAWIGFTNFGDAVQNQAQEWWDTVDSTVNSAVAWLRDNVSGLQTLVSQTIDDFVSGLETFWNGLDSSDADNDAIETVFASIKDIWSDVSTFFGDVGAGITSALGQQWIDLTSLLTTIGSDISDWLGNQGTALADAVAGAVDWFGTGVGDVATAIWDSLKASYSWLADSVSWFSDQIGTVAGNIWTSLKGSYGWLEDAIADVASNVWTSLKGTYSWLEDSITAVWNNIRSGASAFNANVSAAVAAGVNWFSSNIETVATNVIGGFTGAADTAWSWLVGLGNSARSFLTGVTTNFHTALDRLATWLGTAADVGGEILDAVIEAVSSGASSVGAAVQAFLFGSLTPQAFAESEADDQIDASLNSGGAIKTEINDDITAAWNTFWSDTGDAAYQTGQSLSDIIQGIADFFSGGMAASGANTALSNLTGVAINTPLVFGDVDGALPEYGFGRNDDDMQLRMGGGDEFAVLEGSDKLFIVGNPTNNEISSVPLTVSSTTVAIAEKFLISQDTNPGTNERGLGADALGNLYFKTPLVNGKWFFQNSGASNRTELEVLRQGIKIGTGVDSSDPTADGEIKRVGTTLKAYVNGGTVVDFADIESGGGSVDLSAVAQNIIPSGTRDLGSSTARWANVNADRVNFGSGTSYNIQRDASRLRIVTGSGEINLDANGVEIKTDANDEIEIGGAGGVEITIGGSTTDKVGFFNKSPQSRDNGWTDNSTTVTGNKSRLELSDLDSSDIQQLRIAGAVNDIIDLLWRYGLVS